MKIETILQHEESNRDSVILFKEGIFLRAYERSAMRFTEHFAQFKVFRKYYKIVNTDVCYLGFPQKSFPTLLEKFNDIRYTETDYYIVIFGCPSQTDFNRWKASVKLPTIEDVKPQILLREKLKPKDLKNLQIYKSGYDIMLELHRLVSNLPREHKFSVGERIKSEAIEIGLSAYRIGLEKKGTEGRRRIAEGIETVRLLLRMLTDLKLLSLKYFSAVNVKMENLYQAVER